MFMHTSRRFDMQPQPTELFGFLINPQYVAPPNDGWLDINVAEVIPEQQELIEEVLDQVNQPVPQVNVDVAAQLVQEVLVPQQDEANDPLFRDIDQYVEDQRAAGPSSAAGTADDVGPSGKDGETASDSNSDSDSEDDTDRTSGFISGIPAGMIRQGSKLIMDPALKLKRKAVEKDPDFVVIDEEDEDEEEEELPISRPRKMSRHTASTSAAPIQLQHSSSEAETIAALVRPSSHPTTKSSRTAAQLLTDVATEIAKKLQTPVITPRAPSSSSMTDSERVIHLESRVQTLEALVATLSTQVLSLSESVTEQNKAYSTLIQTNSMLMDDIAYKQRQLDRLDRLVTSVHWDQSSQGEFMFYKESCKLDELERQRREDEDDDPNAQKDSELAGPTTTSQHAKVQGESAGASGSGAGTGEGAEEGEA